VLPRKRGRSRCGTVKSGRQASSQHHGPEDAQVRRWSLSSIGTYYTQYDEDVSCAALPLWPSRAHEHYGFTISICASLRLLNVRGAGAFLRPCLRRQWRSCDVRRLGSTSRAAAHVDQPPVVLLHNHAVLNETARRTRGLRMGIGIGIQGRGRCTSTWRHALVCHEALCSLSAAHCCTVHAMQLFLVLVCSKSAAGYASGRPLEGWAAGLAAGDYFGAAGGPKHAQLQHHATRLAPRTAHSQTVIEAGKVTQALHPPCGVANSWWLSGGLRVVGHGAFSVYYPNRPILDCEA
jgi:hypothetical protein